MEEMLKDYHDLMDVKIALDTEILAYRKLIEQEEERLGMSPTSNRTKDWICPLFPCYLSVLSSSGSPAATPAGRGVKRKRTTIVEEDITELVSEHEGRGNVIIEPLDKDGKFIKMTNRSGDELNIGGWTLTNMTGGEDTAYKFHRTTTLQNGETVTVYSSDTREEHEPPLSLVMKRGGWEIGDENVTTVKNKEGKEEAVRNSKKERSLSGSKRYTPPPISRSFPSASQLTKRTSFQVWHVSALQSGRGRSRLEELCHHVKDERNDTQAQSKVYKELRQSSPERIELT